MDPTVPSDSVAAPVSSLGPFLLRERIGAGGMGEVWKAEQTSPVRRTVALKLIKPGMDSREVLARFEAERQALALMDHPCIARVFDAGTTPQGRPWFAMEYVRGIPITDYCDKHRLSTVERLQLFQRVCEAVQHAHQKAVLHRDLKPGNILVADVDERPLPKIIDFGVAKATTQKLTEKTMYTAMGQLIGTPEYMSPEQADLTGEDVDTRTDVYSLGVILYELLVGALPFEPKDLRKAGFEGIRRMIREQDPPRPSTKWSTLGERTTEIAARRRTDHKHLTSQLKGDLDWIVMRCLEKDRNRRYGSPQELGQDIARHLNYEPVIAGPPSAAYRTGKYLRRHRFAVSAAATLVLLLIAFGVTMALQAKRIAQERDRASRQAEVATQVSDFLVGLFEVSDPGESRGKTLTAEEILSTGAARVRESLEEQPEIQARLMATIGDVYTKLGVYKEAEPLLKQAVETYTRVMEPDDPDRLAALNLLADVQWYLSEFTVAEPLYQELVEQTERRFGKEHRRTLKARYDLASLYLATARYEEFERLAREVLETQRRVLGEDDADTISSASNLAGLYYMQKRYAEALPLNRQVLEATRRDLGEDHPTTLQRAHNTALILLELGQYSEAESLLVATLAARRRVLGDSHPQTCLSLANLGWMYRRLDRYAEAEPLLLSAYDGYVRAYSPDHPQTQKTVAWLVELYETWGKPEKAKEWRAKLVAQ